MSVVAVAMVKDELDIIEGWVRHTLGQVDAMLVADNGSTDGTREVLDWLAEALPLTVVDDPDPGFRQSAKMSRLAELAAIDDAYRHRLPTTWIMPVDADEIWYHRGGFRVADVLMDLPHAVATANLFHHVRTSADVDDPDPFRSMVWRQDVAASLPKVAFRWEPGAVVHMGNHGVTLPSAHSRGPYVLEVRHFPVRSPEQLIRKARNGAAAFAAAPEVEGGDHWKSWGQLSNDALTAAFWEHWHYRDPARQLVGDHGHVPPEPFCLVRDPAPYRHTR